MQPDPDAFPVGLIPIMRTSSHPCSTKGLSLVVNQTLPRGIVYRKKMRLGSESAVCGMTSNDQFRLEVMAGFARMMERAGIEAGLPFKCHPHMLRHACGFALANKGHAPAPCERISAIKTSSMVRYTADKVQGLLAHLIRSPSVVPRSSRPR